MNLNYTFYYDESFQDRNMTLVNGIPNNYHEDASDVFVGSFWGCQDKYHSDFIDAYKAFETKYKTRLGLEEYQELKGTNISKSNFKNGISSFNRNAIDFYTDFFSLFHNDIVLHFSLLSKSSEMLEKVFSELNFSENRYNRNAFIYSVIKFLNTYRCYDIFEKFFDITEESSNMDTLNLIKFRLKNIVNASVTSPKKKKENEVFLQLIEILEFATGKLAIDSKYKWDYSNIFLGLDRLLREMNIERNNVTINIDNETNTFKTAQERCVYEKVVSLESNESCGIRVSDILSNFIGRMINSMINELKEPPIVSAQNIDEHDFETKIMFSKEWFDLNEKQFNLYRYIRNIFEERGKYHWTAKTSIFFDFPLLFFYFFHYISQYDNYIIFKEIELDQHCERFNTYCCTNIRKRYRQF